MQQNNVVEVFFDIISPGCYSHLFLVPNKSGGWRPVTDLSCLNSFLEIPDFTMESAESIRRCLPGDAWVTSINILDTYFHIPIHRGYQNVFYFRLGTPYINSGHCRLAFLLHLGYSIDYDRDQNAGTRDGHQSLSVPGRLARLFTNSRLVPPRHCTSAQYLPHDGPPHSRQEFKTDPKTEIPFSGIPIRHGTNSAS